MNNMTIGFIGTGNMGGAIALTVAQAGYEITLANRTKSKAEALADEINKTAGRQLAVCKDNKAAAACDIVFLAVKPYQAEEVIAGIKDSFTAETLIISMMGAVTLSDLESMTGLKRVIRIMPNTPVAIGKGVTLWCAGSCISEADVQILSELMQATGILYEVSQEQFDAITPITGCGPAYAAMFVDALADAGVRLGIKKADAVKYAAQMLAGTAQLILESGKHPVQLKDEVCSPKGTTIKGVIALENDGFRAAVIDAILSAAGVKEL